MTWIFGKETHNGSELLRKCWIESDILRFNFLIFMFAEFVILMNTRSMK